MRAPQTRWQAFLIHFGLSAVIFLVLLYLIVFHWYPFPFFATDGGWQGVRLITGVDLVLGPLLTLIVYRVGKPHLKLDLALIGLVQLVALAWGTWLVYGERIALVTYANGTFYTLTQEQVHEIGGQAQTIARDSDSVPPYSFVQLPADPRARLALVLPGLMAGKMPYHFSGRHEPYSSHHLPEVIAGGADPTKLSQDTPEFKVKLEAFLQHHGGSAQDYVYVPAQSRYGRQLLVLRKLDGKLMDGLDLALEATAHPNPPQP
jgi:hypothetical protein